jgi:hypothetical protein
MVANSLMPHTPEDATGDRANRWGGLPMLDFTGTTTELLKRIPHFEKLAAERLGMGGNAHADVVVANMNDGRKPVPVGLVSKTYNLVQHGELIERALKWIKSVPGATVPDQIELSATPNFERIFAKFDLGEGLSISPDGEPVRLQLVCRNSVDGSTAIRARLGWYRLVCSNGMIVGVTLGRTRLTHKPEADLNDAFTPLSDEMSIVVKDKDMIQKWSSTTVSLNRVRAWVDGPLVKAWNPLAACRVWAISSTGRDARFLPPFEKVLPSNRIVELLKPVPGSPSRAVTIYDVVQAMSWVASRRTDVDEVEQRQRQIGELAESLMN